MKTLARIDRFSCLPFHLRSPEPFQKCEGEGNSPPNKPGRQRNEVSHDHISYDGDSGNNEETEENLDTEDHEISENEDLRQYN